MGRRRASAIADALSAGGQSDSLHAQCARMLGVTWAPRAVVDAALANGAARAPFLEGANTCNFQRAQCSNYSDAPRPLNSHICGLRNRRAETARSAETAPQVTRPATSRYGATVARVVSAMRTRPPHMFAHLSGAWRNARVRGRGWMGGEVGVESVECKFTRHFSRDCDHLTVDANVKFYVSVDAP